GGGGCVPEGGAPRAAERRGVRARAEGGPRRNQSEYDSGDDGDADREGKYTDVEPGVGAGGQCVWRHREKRANGAESERKTQSRRDQRQHQTLGEQLLNDATRGRADGRANRNLVLACRRADEQQ